MEKRKSIKVRSARDKMLVSELTKERRKARQCDKCMTKNNENLVLGTSDKIVKRKIGRGRNQMYAVNPNRELTYNRTETAKAARL